MGKEPFFQFRVCVLNCTSIESWTPDLSDQLSVPSSQHQFEIPSKTLPLKGSPSENPFDF